MFNKLIEIIDGENQQMSIFGMLRLIRFDIDPDQDKKPFEKYVAVCPNIEDAKGNPGSIGQLFLTNLRLIWQMKADSYINVVIGLDSINSVQIKTTPVQWGNGFKHLLIVKAQNPTQTRYQFRFVGYNSQQVKIFNQVTQMRKKIIETKSFRCTNLAVRYQNDFQPMNGEQVKDSYNNALFYEDHQKFKCKLFVTNARLVIIKEGQKKMNYGIVWLMIREIDLIDQENMSGIRLFCRGLLSSKLFVVACSKITQNKKLQSELKSFVQLYNKAPILGFIHDEKKKPEVQPITAKNQQIQQLESTKINLVRRKNIYTTSEGLGSIENTQFNSELGLMMEKLPQGVNRIDLWQILK